MKKFVALLVIVSFVSLVFAGCAVKTSPIDKNGNPKLVRIPEKGVLGGVCAGLAYYFGINVTLLRVGWVVAVFGFGIGIIAYLVLWIVIPEATNVPMDYGERAGG